MRFCQTLSILLICAFISCSKETYVNPYPTTPKEYNVQFNVAPFNVSYANMSTQENNHVVLGGSNDVNTGYIRNIYIAAYDVNGSLATVLSQQYGQADFGSFNTKLNPGNYTLVIAAGNMPWSSFSDPGNNYISNNNFPGLLSNLYIGSTHFATDSLGDVFYYKQPITISKDTSFNNLVLSRLTGAFQINLLDSIPAGSFFKVTVKNAPYRYNVGLDVLQTSAQNNWYFNYYSNNYPFYCLGSSNPLTMELNVSKYNPSTYTTETIYSKTVTNVYIYPNKKTILTGKINDAANANMPISVDTSFVGIVQQNF